MNSGVFSFKDGGVFLFSDFKEFLINECSTKKFLIQEGDKKIIVLLNEVFKIDDCFYAIISLNQNSSLLFQDQWKSFEFEHLTDQFFLFLRKAIISCFMFDLQIKYGVKNRFKLLVFILSFFLIRPGTLSDEEIENKNASLRNHIYSSYEKIIAIAKPFPELKEDIPIVQIKKIEKKPLKLISKKKSVFQDADTQFF